MRTELLPRRVKQPVFQARRLILAALIPLVITQGGCVRENPHPGPDSKDGLVLTLSITAAGQTSARALSAAAESTINTIDLLVFNDDGQGADETFLYHTHGTPGDSPGSYRFNLKRSTGSNKHRLVVLANFRQELDDAIAANLFDEGDTKQVVFAALNFDTSSTWDTSTPRYLPMWGESSDTYAVTETLMGYHIGPISLLRSVARIDVALNADSNGEGQGLSNFRLKDVMVYNSSAKGLVAPDSDNLSAGKAESPTLPAGLSRGKIHYQTDESVGQTDKTGLVREIYVAEADNNFPGATLTDVTCLVISGYYNGSIKETWYRIDLINKAKTPPPGDYILWDILRNYHYLVNITRVDGPGYDTEQEAFNSLPININTEVIAWNEGDLNDITTDGQYKLQVNTDSLYFYREGREQLLSIMTDHPDGWSLEIESPSLDWVTADMMSGNTNIRDSVGIQCDPILLLPEADREGYIVIKAGRMRKYIKIYQANIAELTIDVEPESMYFRRSGANPKFITVTTYPGNEPVYFSLAGTDPSEWIYLPVTYTGMSNQVSYRLQPLPNDTGDIRASVLTVFVRNGETIVSRTVTINQLLDDLTFNYQHQYVVYPAAGGNDMFITVESAVDWQIVTWTGPSGMISLTDTDLHDNLYNYVFGLSSNPTYAPREARLHVISPDIDFPTQDITVTQGYFEPVFEMKSHPGNEIDFGTSSSPVTLRFDVNSDWSYQPNPALDNILNGIDKTAGQVYTGGAANYPQEQQITLTPNTYTAVIGTPPAGTNEEILKLVTENHAPHSPRAEYDIRLSITVPSFYSLTSVSPIGPAATSAVTVTAVAETNDEFKLYTTSNPTGHTVPASDFGEKTATVTIPATNGWGTVTNTVYTSYNGQVTNHGNVTQQGYYITSATVNAPATIRGDGGAYTVTLTGSFPNTLVRAYGSGLNNQVTVTAGTSRTATIIVGNNQTGGNRYVYFQYSTDGGSSWQTAFSTNLQTRGNITLKASGKQVALINAINTQTWAYCLGIGTYWDSNQLTVGTSYNPEASTGCSSYSEYGAPAGSWRAPTLAEMKEICARNNEMQVPATAAHWWTVANTATHATVYTFAPGDDKHDESWSRSKTDIGGAAVRCVRR